MKNVEKYSDYPALIDKNDIKYTYKDYYEEAIRFAKSCVKIGMNPLEVAGLIGFNSAEYFFGLHGCWMAGCVPAGIYTTNSPDACHYVLNHSDARICVCQGGKNAMKIASIRESLPNLKAIIVYWTEEGVPKVEDKEGVAKIFTWEEWMRFGESIPTSTILDRVHSIKPGNCATLIYTSGTTVNIIILVLIIRVIQRLLCVLMIIVVTMFLM